MFWTLEQVTGPVGDLEPVTLPEARLQVREFDDVTANDAHITSLITSAREWAEDYTGRALVDQTWRLTVGDVYREAVPLVDTQRLTQGTEEWRRTSGLLLRRSPIIAITAFNSIDNTSTETAVDATHYELREGSSKWPRLAALTGATWPTLTSGIDLQVTFRAGFADQTGSPQTGVEVIPERFRQAILLHVEAFYKRDDDMEKLLAAAKNLLKGQVCHVGFA